MNVAMCAQADVIDTSGQEPFESCGYCHGFDGNPATARFPALAGQSSGYLRKQLLDFRARLRTDSGEMLTAAEPLTPEQIDVVVEYFSAQPMRGAWNPLAGSARNSAGEALYLRGKPGVTACIACHLPADQDAPFEYPRLLGQPAEYLERQLLAFRAGTRSNDPAGVMRTIASRLSAAEIAAVAGYAARGE